MAEQRVLAHGPNAAGTSGPGSLLHGQVAGVILPRYPTGFTYVAARFTSVAAVLGFCILGSTRLRRWYAASLGICAFVFFAWMYQDTGRLTQNGSAGGGVGERASAGDTRDPKENDAQGIQSRRCSYRGPGLYRAVLRL